MVTPKLVRKLLQFMYQRHIEAYGYRKSNLSNSFLYITSGPGLEQEIPNIFEIRNGMKRYFVVDIAKELAGQGFVEFSADNAKFWLTEAGFEEARKNSLSQLLDFLNKNGGISIIISAISLGVAIISLGVAIWALLKK